MAIKSNLFSTYLRERQREKSISTPSLILSHIISHYLTTFIQTSLKQTVGHLGAMTTSQTTFHRHTYTPQSLSMIELETRDEHLGEIAFSRHNTNTAVQFVIWFIT